MMNVPLSDVSNSLHSNRSPRRVRTSLSCSSTSWFIHAFEHSMASILTNHLVLNLRRVGHVYTQTQGSTLPELEFATNAVVGNLGASFRPEDEEEDLDDTLRSEWQEQERSESTLREEVPWDTRPIFLAIHRRWVVIWEGWLDSICISLLTIYLTMSHKRLGILCFQCTMFISLGVIICSVLL